MGPATRDTFSRKHVKQWKTKALEWLQNIEISEATHLSATLLGLASEGIHAKTMKSLGKTTFLRDSHGALQGQSENRKNNNNHNVRRVGISAFMC